MPHSDFLDEVCQRLARVDARAEAAREREDAKAREEEKIWVLEETGRVVANMARLCAPDSTTDSPWRPLWVPEQLRPYVPRAFHAQCSHLGPKATYQTMREVVYWPRMPNDVADYAERTPAVPRVISLEGNIGAGKSTLLQHLKDRFAGDDSVVFVDEPVAEWAHHGFLHRVYTEAATGLPFQMMVLASLVCDLRNAISRKPVPRLVITECSPLGNYRVFAKANLGDADMRMFEFTFNRLMTARLDVEYLFHRADTSTLSKRIRGRGRSAESDISTIYLGVLDELHDTWLLSEQKVHVLDANHTVHSSCLTACVNSHVWMELQTLPDGRLKPA